MLTQKNLYSSLLELDGCGYKAYKEIKNSYEFPDFTLIIDYVQGDPFANPSKLRMIIPQTKAGFPAQLYQSHSREVALRDYLTREFAVVAQELSRRRGTGKSGMINISTSGQEILARNSAFINNDFVEVRFVVGLPARGRTILGRQAAQMLCEDIPEIFNSALQYQ